MRNSAPSPSSACRGWWSTATPTTAPVTAPITVCGNGAGIGGTGTGSCTQPTGTSTGTGTGSGGLVTAPVTAQPTGPSTGTGTGTGSGGGRTAILVDSIDLASGADPVVFGNAVERSNPVVLGNVERANAGLQAEVIRALGSVTPAASLAFTGAEVGNLLALALALLILGAGAVVAGRRRRIS